MAGVPGPVASRKRLGYPGMGDPALPVLTPILEGEVGFQSNQGAEEGSLLCRGDQSGWCGQHGTCGARVAT